jgi:predicted permease
MQANAGHLVYTFFLLLGLGVILRRLGVLTESETRVFVRLVTDVSLPALVILSLSRASFSWSLIGMVGIGWFVLLLSFGFASLLGSMLRLPDSQRGVLIVSGSVSNTGFLGVPLIYSLLGDKPSIIAAAVTFDMAVTTLALYSVGVLVFTRFSTANEGTLDWEPFKRIVRMPLFWATAVGYGLMLNGLRLPPFLEFTLEKLANLTVPLVLLAIGVMLHLQALGPKLWRMVIVVAFKCLLVPGLMIGTLYLTGIRGDTARVMILLAAMPSAMVSAILAAHYHNDAELAAASVTVSTLLSALLLSFWLRVPI